MRRIAVINQKGGVGKTTTSANLGAALAQQARRVVVVDMDAQANLSMSLGVEVPSDAPSTYTVLSGATSFGAALRPTAIDGLTLLPSNIDLSGAELELASSIGREFLMRDALREWESEARKAHGRAPADYVIFDCPPSLGLLSINALAAASEVLITLQTEFLALQGMSKLVEVVQLLRRRLNPELTITGILPCLYDSRLKLAREVLGEIRTYFPDKVLAHPVRSNVKLAEAPSFGKTIFEYAPDSNGANDYRLVAREVIAHEHNDADLAGLPPFDESSLTPTTRSVASANESSSVESAASEAQPIVARRKPIARAAIGDAPTRSDDVAFASAPSETHAIAQPSAATNEGRVEIAEAALDARRESSVATTPLDARATALDVSAQGSATAVLEPIARIDVETARELDIEPEAVAHDARAELREHELVPVPAPVRSERQSVRSLRAEDLPALPPDAFEILTSYVHDR